MRVAVVHDWLSDWAGSEKVLEQILLCYPQADLFALVDSLSDADRAKLGRRARTTFVQRLPFAKRRPWAYLPLLPLAVEQFDLSGYDLILSSSHAVAKGVITCPDQLHLSYVHSPMRYAWDLQHQYLQGAIGRGMSGLLARGLLHYLRIWDQRTANGVHAFAANSGFVARRIWKTYRRTATVIYPPVALERFSAEEDKDDYYICASRLMQYKRIDIVINAFAQLGTRRLVVVGDGPEYKRLKAIAGSNVEFLGRVPDEVLSERLRRARAFLFPGVEDFGIAPVEAQACGTPVIAYGKGGATETVRDIHAAEPTGTLFHEQSAEAVQTAILRFEKNRHLFKSSHCRKNAERFSAPRFREEYSSFVNQSIAELHLNGRDDVFPFATMTSSYEAGNPRLSNNA